MWNQKHLLTFAIAIGFACAIARGAAGPEKTSSDVNLSWKSLPADLPCPFAPASRAEMTELIETTMNVFEPSLRRTPIAITATTDPKLGGKGSFLNASKMDGGI